jgi:hypothetical protein
VAVERLYFPCRVRLNGSDVFLLWYTDERDGFLRLPGGRLLLGSSIDGVAASAARVGVALASEAPASYDFDRLRAWCQRPSAGGIEYSPFLDAWNLFDDLAGLHAAPESEYGRLSWAAAGCYDKLFWGSNLPSVTPPGARFEPSWSPEELVAVTQVFEAGINCFVAKLAGNSEDAEPGVPADVGGLDTIPR